MYSDLLERYIITKCDYLQDMGVTGSQVWGGREVLTVYLLYMSECTLYYLFIRKHIEQFVKILR